MPIAEYTVDTVSSWVLRKLGHPVIAVRLTKEQLADSVEEAVESFSRRLPTLKLHAVDMPPTHQADPYAEARTMGTPVGRNSYRFRLTTFGLGVFEVENGERNILDWMMQFGFPIPLEYRTFGLALEKYEAYLMWQEEAKRLFSAEFEWRWEEPYLYVANVPDSSTKLFYSYWDFHDLSSIPLEWRKWVKDYALAEAKGTLAKIRGKYQTVPSPGGGVQMDASELQSQHEQEKERLIEDLENARGDLAPVMG